MFKKARVAFSFLTPNASNLLNKLHSGLWARFALIASVMRTAASSCQPGKFDELLKSVGQANFKMVNL